MTLFAMLTCELKSATKTLLNQFFRNTGRRSTQVITGQLYIFNKNWRRACAVST